MGILVTDPIWQSCSGCLMPVDRVRLDAAADALGSNRAVGKTFLEELCL